MGKGTNNVETKRTSTFGENTLKPIRTWTACGRFTMLPFRHKWPIQFLSRQRYPVSGYINLFRATSVMSVADKLSCCHEADPQYASSKSSR